MSELSENDLINISNFKVTSADTDMKGRIRLGSFVNLLIQAAINSADSLGFGVGGLRRENLVWVLSRLTVEIDRHLLWYEDVEVQTWPKNIDRMLYLRDFNVMGKDGGIMARATSGWLAIDIERRRPKHVDGIHMDPFIQLKDKHAIKTLPEKLESVSDGEEFEVQSTYYDLDLNNHVTATRYIDWVMNALPVEYHLVHYPRRLSINYMKETMPGESVRFIKQAGRENQFVFEGVNLSKNTTAFRCKIDF